MTARPAVEDGEEEDKDPFQAFLAARSAAGTRSELTLRASGGTEGGKASFSLSDIIAPQRGGGSREGQRSIGKDPFATFKALRPQGENEKEEEQRSQGAQKGGLAGERALLRITNQVSTAREDVLRIKLKMLELSLQSEKRSFLENAGSPVLPSSPLYRTPAAEKCLRHPERTSEAWSCDTSEGSPEDAPPYGAAPTAPGKWKPSQALSRSNPTSASSPSLSRQVAQSEQSAKVKGTEDSLHLPPITPTASQESMLSGWWPKTSNWNVLMKDKVVARRRNLKSSGGSVLLGDGPAPERSNSMISGHFFAFQVMQVDDTNHPLDQLRGASIGFGFSQLPASHPSCDHPVYAYEIPKCILVGYGPHFIDGRRWQKTDYDPRFLRVGDCVGVLLTSSGDLIVFVNGSPVLRVPTSLAEEAPVNMASGAMRRTPPLYPVCDLHGRIYEVQLLPYAGPPHAASRRTRLK